MFSPRFYKFKNIYIGTLAFIAPSTTISSLFSSDYININGMKNVCLSMFYNIGIGVLTGVLYPISLPYYGGKMLCDKLKI